MTFQSELDAGLDYKVNVVVGIGDTPTYFSKRAVDSGLTVDADKVGLVGELIVNPTSVNLTRVKTNIDSTTVTILDGLEENQVFTLFMGSDANSLIGLPIKIYIGLNTDAGFDFSDYVLINSYVIRNINKSGAAYSVKGTSRTFDFQTPFFDTKGNLNTAISASDTTILVDTATDIFQTAAVTGRLRLVDGDKSEFVVYTGKSFLGGVTTFTGVSRADQSSVAAAFAVGVEVQEVTKLEGNPLDLFLQLVISGSGASGAGAPYDILHDGLALDEDEIDIAAIEAIRDADFPSDTFRLFLYDVPNALKMFENKFFKPNNIRIISTTSGKISLAILNQSVPGATLPELDENNTMAKPGWSTTKDNIINKFNVKWAWSEGLKTFTRITEFTDADSIATFLERKGPDIEIEGAQADISGQSLVNNRGNTFLARFSTPETSITCNSFFKTYANNVGDNVLMTHSELPAPGGGGLGMSEEVEILSKGMNVIKALVRFKLVFTSYFNIRTGLIAPSPNPTVINSQSSIDVVDGTCYKPGYVIFMKDASGVPLADGSRIIDTVVGNTITFTTPFVTTLLTTFQIKFVDYDLQSIDQFARYASVGDNAGTFSNDGTTIYKIAI